MENSWNPWHGCTKISPGCLNCYVYRMDNRYKRDPKTCVRTHQFDLPVRRDRYGNYKIPSGTQVYTCFTSDFFLEDADEMRPEAWNYIRERKDLFFLIITKRIDRFLYCIPDNWGDGWENVNITCTVENQQMANYRLPIYRTLPIKHKAICAEPLLEYIDLSIIFSDPRLEYVISGGESGPNARYCFINWAIQMKYDCDLHGIPYCFKQTGARIITDHMITIPRRHQFRIAEKFGLNSFNINDSMFPRKEIKENLQSPIYYLPNNGGDV